MNEFLRSLRIKLELSRYVLFLNYFQPSRNKNILFMKIFNQFNFNYFFIFIAVPVGRMGTGAMLKKIMMAKKK